LDGLVCLCKAPKYLREVKAAGWGTTWTAEKQLKAGESNLMLCLTAESQNHRMVEVGRVIWSNPPAQEGPGHIWMAFECLQGRTLHHPSRQPIPVLSHPHISLLMFRVNLPRFSLRSLPVDLSLGTTVKSLALSSAPSLMVFVYVDEAL